MTDDEPYLIKRYSNRKLYDSVRRRFTTLDEIAVLLDAGARIVVRDHDVGTDRTDEVLAQLIRRRAQSRPRTSGSGASSLLAELLRAPAEVAQSVVGGLAAQPDAGGPAAAPEDDGAPADPPADPPAQEEASAMSGAAEAGDEAESAAATAKPDRADRRDEEIRELREQVSALTEAVTLLLREKSDRGE